jgi:Zn-dependent M28 family amino/carboxypeptidase
MTPSVRLAVLRSLSTPLLAALLLAACASPAPNSDPYQDPAVQGALNSISADDMLKHIRVLSSDEFGGRLPGTKGEDLSVVYIAEQFAKLGLAPGNPDGTYTQQVPLVGITSKPVASIEARGKTLPPLQFPKDYVAFSPRVQNKVSIDKSELVFVGYGVIAPEYGWDDYKGLDVRGKTLVMLINDPQIPDPRDPSKLDDTMFRGKAMTYYGRWTYKYEIAAKLGAAAAIIVHETAPAAYPFEVVINSWSRENFSIKSAGPNPDFPDVAAWIQLDRAKELFAASGYDFDAMKRAALSRDFKPVRLPATVSFHVDNTWRDVASHNVVAKLEGADPRLKNEYVIYSAHWDHLGVQPEGNGVSLHDRVYHGAVDNASGVAALLSFAKAYAQLPQHPQRSILFVATTAEEQGLLGAKYYAQHPLYPLSQTLANINVDTINVWGRTSDVATLGQNKSTLDDMLTTLAAREGRVVKPDPRPDRGGFYRSDQFELAKVGVPVMHARSGNTLIGRPEGTGEELSNEYTAHRYHKPSDVILPDWDLSGAVEDERMLFLLGYGVAQSSQFPQWQAGSEFKPARDATMAGRP